MSTLLAFDTATERMSLALAVDGRVWTHESAGGAAASATLMPAIISLLARADTSMRQLDAIAFGRGPGAFTGLRTACAVAQGLALGLGRPVLSLDTLMAVAEDARGGDSHWQGWVVIDARMNEIYAAHYRHAQGAWQVLEPPRLCTAQTLNARWLDDAPLAVAGNALAAFDGQLQSGAARCQPDAAPRAAALLPLAASLWQRGAAIDPALALPLYVRDNVAQTTTERAAVLAAKLALASPESVR